MGKKCFVPWCNSGYSTCTEKVSLFEAPKDANRLEIWRHAIAREDRILQPRDSVCEKHFEPKFITKTWEATYKGHVLMSVPRKALLAKDAVPTKFPDCPNKIRKKKQPAGTKRVTPVSPVYPASNGTSDTFDPVQIKLEPPRTPEPLSESMTAAHTKSACDVFFDVFDEAESAVLPNAAWACHKVEIGGLRTVVYSEVQLLEATTPLQDAAASEAGYKYFTAHHSHIITRKVVSVDSDLNIAVTLLGKRAPRSSELPCKVSCVQDIEFVLSRVNEISLCTGGPSAEAYPDVQPESVLIDMTGHWRHKQCALILENSTSMCSHCKRVPTTLRIHKKRITEKSKEKQQPRRLHMTSRGATNMAPFRKS